MKRSITEQRKPLATIEETIFTMPARFRVLESNVAFTNLGATTDYAYMRIVKEGEPLSDKQWYFYGVDVLAGETVILDAHHTVFLEEGASLRVKSAGGNLAANYSAIITDDR
jgi:hypothetical protein